MAGSEGGAGFEVGEATGQCDEKEVATPNDFCRSLSARDST